MSVITNPIRSEKFETFVAPTIGANAPQGTTCALEVAGNCCNPTLLVVLGGTGGKVAGGRLGGS